MKKSNFFLIGKPFNSPPPPSLLMALALRKVFFAPFLREAANLELFKKFCCHLKIKIILL